MEQHLYRDVIAVCGADALCFVRNSNPLEEAFGQLHAVLLDINTQKEMPISSTYFAVGAGPSIHRFCLGEPHSNEDCPQYSSILSQYHCSVSSCIVIIRLVPTSSQYLSVSEENIVFIVPPANMTIPAAAVSFNVSESHACWHNPSEICTSVTLPLLPQGQSPRLLTIATGVSVCGIGAGDVCDVDHQGTGQISSKQPLSHHGRTRRPVSAHGSTPRLVAAGYS
jgi:hypothetical protein